MIVLTSVVGVFNGNHTDPDTGVSHGHDYEVEAGWLNTKERYEVLRAKLRAELSIIDHGTLPAWSAEEVAVWLLEKIGCDQIKLNRPIIGHFVTASK